jgi:hypothetical protein
LDPRLADSIQAEGGGFLMAIQIRSTPYFGGEEMPEAPCRKILGMLKVPSKYERRYFIRPNS